MKILIIEDEEKAAAFLELGLTENGYAVDVARNGEDGLHLAQTGVYDLIILDAMMPKIDGWNVIQKLRADGVSTLAMFLTARDSLEDRVRGLESGADAYLVKPFSFMELLANVRTLLRRAPNTASDIIKIADLTVDIR